MVAIAAFGTDRFLAAAAVLPVASHTSQQGLWLTQTRYQAPYPDARAAIVASDRIDAQLADLDPVVDPANDVIVVDSVDGGMAFYRQAGWELPRQRVTLIGPGAATYDEHDGSLYYLRRTTVAVGPGGRPTSSPRRPSRTPGAGRHGNGGPCARRPGRRLPGVETPGR